MEGTGYVDSLSISDLKGKARQVLTDSNNAFDQIGPIDASLIDDFLVLRNEIAHQSRAARRRSEQVMKKNGLVKLPTASSYLKARGRIFAYTEAFWSAEEDMRLFLGLRPRSAAESFYTFYQIPEVEEVSANPST